MNTNAMIEKRKPGKYQAKLDPWSSHSIIVSLLRSFPHGTRILDVGTASGTIGQMCQGRGFILRGIEPVKEWAEASLPYYEEINIQDLHHTEDEYLQGHQVVICADVLEHMPDPQQQLNKLASLQSTGTLFIVSVPNIANLWIRINLLLGKFDYADRGILDRTHLHFFTRRTIIDLLECACLDITKVDITPIPLNLVSPLFVRTSIGRWLHAVLDVLTRIFPTILGYQFVISAEKRSPS